jgi:hypothetical protein
MSTVYYSSTSLARCLLMCCLWASSCWTVAFLLKMDSCSWWCLSISHWTLSSFSTLEASSSEASSSRSCSWICSSLMSPWMTCIAEGARGGDWCEAPPLVLVELAPPPFWLEPVAVVDMLLAGWCSWTSGISPKVGCSGPSVMVERIRVDGW